MFKKVYCSAKTGHNINKLFKSIVKMMEKEHMVTTTSEITYSGYMNGDKAKKQKKG
jgi:predicted GTPase